MKKLISLSFLCLLFSTAYSQKLKNVDASFSCQTKLVPDSTMDLEFTLYLSNNDNEYGDSLAIEFEPGVTPNGTPNDPLGPVSFGQNPEAFNGVFGQLMSWGNNNNGAELSGIETQKYYQFKVNVSIDDTVTFRKKVRFHVSGDSMKFYPFGTPRDDDGFIFLELQQPQPELGVTFTSPVPEYYLNPKRQLKDTLPLEATVTNYGTTLAEQAILVFDASSGGFYSSEQLPRPFQENSSITKKSTVAFKPKANRTYNFTVKVISPIDADTLNNQVFASFAVTDSVLAREDGVLADSVNVLDPGVLGSVYRLTKLDTIASISAYITNPVVGDSIRFEIFNMVIKPTALLSYSTTLIFDSTSTSGWYTLPLIDTVAFENTSFFVGVHLYTSETYLGVNPVNYFYGTNFLQANGGSTFDHSEPFGSQHENNYMLRVNIGKPWDLKPNTVGVQELSKINLQIYPNPSSKSIYVNGLIVDAKYSIRLPSGEVVARGVTKGSVINVEQLPIGLYILQIKEHVFKFVRN